MADARIEELRKGFQAWGAQMESQVEAMRQAFNKNHLAYSQAFGNVEARLCMMQAVLNDMVAGDVILDDEGKISWDEYAQQYQAALEEALQKDRALKQATTEVAPEIVRELQEEVFGGDYGAGSQAGGDREVPQFESESSGETSAGDEQGGSGDDDGEGPESDPVPEVSRDDGANESA